MNQLSHRLQIPWWLYIVLFMEIWPMFVGPYLALTNPAFLGGPEASNLVVGSLIYLARYFAVGIAFFMGNISRILQKQAKEKWQTDNVSIQDIKAYFIENLVKV